MTSSFSITGTDTFSLSHARRLAGKVSADLAQCRSFYGQPTPTRIDEYNEELTTLLAGRYVQAYEFGFQRNDQRVVSWQYQAGPAGTLVGGRAGGLTATADISGASFFNFLSHSPAWAQLDESKRQNIEAKLPITRSVGSLPADGHGRWVHDRDYSSGGLALLRKEFRPW